MKIRVLQDIYEDDCGGLINDGYDLQFSHDGVEWVSVPVVHRLIDPPQKRLIITEPDGEPS